MSALHKLFCQPAIGFIVSSALLCACSRTSEPSIIGRWVPVDAFSKNRGAFEEYRSDSTFVLRASSEVAPFHGRYSVRRDSLFTVFSAIDSTLLFANSLPSEAFVEEGVALIGEFKLTWLDSDTLLVESGQGVHTARTVLVRDLSVRSSQ